MNSINVISIDPAKSAISALHPEVFERLARECRVSRDMTEYTLSSKKILNFFFGINKKTGNKLSLALLSARFLASSSMIAYTLLSGVDFSSFSTGWIVIGLAISLFFGLFTRFASALSFGFFAYLSSLSFMGSGIIDFSTIIPAIISMIFCFSGPGIFSIDQIQRKAFIKYSKKAAQDKANRLAQRRLSYQAIKYM